MDNYVKLAMPTCAPGDNLLHCTLGLVTEAAEIASAGDQVEMKEEMGDLMWYVAVGCDHFGVTMWEAINAAPTGDPRDGLTLIGDFANQVKRQIFYKKPLDPAVMISLLGEIIISLKMDCEEFSLEFSEVLSDNIAKLKKRYPRSSLRTSQLTDRVHFNSHPV